MKKNLNIRDFLIGIFLFLSLILSSCTDSQGSSQSGIKTSDFGIEDSFVSGNGGLSIQFQEGAPPQETRDNGISSFNIRVIVENLGEADILESTAFVSLSGFNEDDFGVSETSKSIRELKKVSKKADGSQIQGGSQIVSFNGFRYEKEIPGIKFPQKFYANICYPYQTTAVAILCVSGDTTYNPDETTKICELDNPLVPHSNSAGPVRIENVKQYAYGESSIEVVFDIVHNKLSSESTLFENGALDETCSVKDDFSLSENKVEYKFDFGLNKDVDCEGLGENSNIVSLYKTSNSQADQYTYNVNCIIDTTNLGDFYQPIEISLDYQYRDRISTQVEIIHVDQ